MVYDRANSSISQIEPGMIDWDKVLEGATWFQLDRHYSSYFPGSSGCLS